MVDASRREDRRPPPRLLLAANVRNLKGGLPNCGVNYSGIGIPEGDTECRD
jgi:hypothetical protein